MKIKYHRFWLVILLTFVSFLGFSQKKTNTSSTQNVDLLKNVTENSLDLEFIKVNEVTDRMGTSIETYEQYYKGLQIEFGQIKLLNDSNGLTTFTGDLSPIGDIDVNPKLNESTALTAALRFVNAEEYAWSQRVPNELFPSENPRGSLMILPKIPYQNKTHRLVYKFEIYASQPLYGANIYIDAVTGDVVFENKLILHTDVPATGDSVYNGNVSFTAETSGIDYRLHQTGRGGGIQTYTFNGGTTVGASIHSPTTVFNHREGVQAIWGAEKTYDYFLQEHNRNSFDNNGGLLRAYVNYATGYNNAFWVNNTMVFGDGDGTTYSSFVALDVTGHEFTHGVIQNAANLVYSYESGALNESFADIFGEMIELFGSGTFDWLIGEDIVIESNAALRSFINPNAFGHPDTYAGTNWYTGSGDSGGVHFNSSVQNHWFYLLSQGAVGVNDNGDSYSVDGIGIEKAAQIAYRNLTVHLGPNSQYIDARNGSIQAAIDLYGVGSFEVMSVTNAWHAVGVGLRYGQTGNNLTCATGTLTISVTLDDHPEDTVFLIYNNAGNVVAATQSYAGQAPWSTVNLTVNIPAGDYLFTAYDRNGDGLASGASYELSYAGGVLASGNNFKYSDATHFCMNATSGGVLDVTRPTSASNLTASNITDTSIQLDWDPASDNVAVALYQVLATPNLFSGVGLYNTNGAILTGLTPNTTYTYMVSSRDAMGNISDANSNTISVTTLASGDVIAPTIPTNLLAQNVTETQLNLSWNASTDNIGVTEYEVYQDGTLIGATSAVNFAVTGLQAGTAYIFEVLAKDAAGNSSGMSNTVSVTTLSPDMVHQGSFENGWDDWVDGGADCKRWRFNGTNAPVNRSHQGIRSIRLRDNSGVDSSMTLTNLDFTSYNSVEFSFFFYPFSMENNEDFWVQYFDGSGWVTIAQFARGVAFSNENFYEVNLVLSDVDFNFVSNGQFRIQCDASGNGDHIYIDETSVLGFSDVQSSSVSIQQVANSRSQNETVPNELKNEEAVLLAINSAFIYPNPTKNSFQLAWDQNVLEAIDFITIYDLQGRIIKTVSFDGNPINVEVLQPGTYFVVINNGSYSKTFKLLKQ